MPCYNEASHLEENTLKVYNYVKKNFNINFNIVLADSNSTDDTSKISKKLAKKYKGIKYCYAPIKGKGIGMRTAVKKYNYDWYIMYDSDMAVEPESLTPMIKLIKSEKYDLICARRHGKGAKLITSTKRKILSYGTTLMVNFVLLNFKIKDSQAGFKAWNNKVRETIWPLIEDTKFFFDIELIHFSYKKKFNITYLPVIYRIDEGKKGGSSVKIFKHVLDSFIKLLKLRFRKI